MAASGTVPGTYLACSKHMSSFALLGSFPALVHTTYDSVQQHRVHFTESFPDETEARGVWDHVHGSF